MSSLKGEIKQIYDAKVSAMHVTTVCFLLKEINIYDVWANLSF